MDLPYAKRLIQKTKADFEKIAKQFSKTRVYPRPEMGYFVKKYVKSGQKILDVGCGNGRIFELLKNKNIDYTGIDGSKTLISEARKKYPNEKFFVKDALRIEFKRKNFDLIFAFAFLHHLPSENFRKKFLEIIYKILKPQRYFVCTVWNLFPKDRIKCIEKFNAEKLAGKTELDFNDTFIPWKNTKGEILAKRYYHGFTRSELKRLFEETGFRIGELFYEKKGKKSNIGEADNLCIAGQKLISQ